MPSNTDADLEVPPNAIVIQPEDDLDYPGTPPPCMSPVSHDVSHEEDLLDASTSSAPDVPGAEPDGVSGGVTGAVPDGVPGGITGGVPDGIPGGITGGVPDTIPDRVLSEPDARLAGPMPTVPTGLSFLCQKQLFMSFMICTYYLAHMPLIIS